VVRPTEGEHKGRVGYYDDDDEEGVAIAYFEDPMKCYCTVGLALLTRRLT